MPIKESSTKRSVENKAKPSKKKPTKTDGPPCACVPPAPDGIGEWTLKSINGAIQWVNDSTQVAPLRKPS